jgi:RNA polymerase sigma-70 factor (ECF subfamily)
MGDEPEVIGLLALLLLQDSRRSARMSEDGELLLLEDQDRSLWDRESIAEGLDRLQRAMDLGRPGSYQLQAAIAALHAEAARPEDTNWEQIVLLYGELLQHHPSPVIELNRAVALAMARGPAPGLEAVEALERSGRLDGYLYLHATRADLLRRLGRNQEAREAYRRALNLAGNAPERRFLKQRISALAP